MHTHMRKQHKNTHVGDTNRLIYCIVQCLFSVFLSIPMTILCAHDKYCFFFFLLSSPCAHIQINEPNQSLFWSWTTNIRLTKAHSNLLFILISLFLFQLNAGIVAAWILYRNHIIHVWVFDHAVGAIVFLAILWNVCNIFSSCMACTRRQSSNRHIHERFRKWSSSFQGMNNVTNARATMEMENDHTHAQAPTKMEIIRYVLFSHIRKRTESTIKRHYLLVAGNIHT